MSGFQNTALSEEWNPVWENPHQILVFCTSRDLSAPWGLQGPYVQPWACSVKSLCLIEFCESMSINARWLLVGFSDMRYGECGPLTNLILNICSREILLEWIRFTQSNTKWMKSATRASNFRMHGNEKFRKRDDAGSLVFYTQSVVNAPRDSEELSLALANRSAALFHLGAYQVSIFWY